MSMEHVLLIRAMSIPLASKVPAKSGQAEVGYLRTLGAGIIFGIHALRLRRSFIDWGSFSHGVLVTRRGSGTSSGLCPG